MTHPRLNPELFSKAAIRRGQQLPEKSVQNVKLQQTALGFVGIASVAGKDRTYSLALQLGPNGEYQGLGCSCERRHCAHMVRVMTSQALTQALDEFGVAAAQAPAAPAPDQPPVPDASETEPVQLPLDAQGQAWLNKLRAALPGTELSDRPLRLQLAPVPGGEGEQALSVTLYADPSGGRGHLGLFHLSDYLQSYTGVVRSRRSLPGPLRTYQSLLEGLAAHAMLTSLGGQEAWRLPADAHSESWLLEALNERLLFWGDHPAPLTLGPDLQEPLEWQLDARGHQRLRRAAAPELAALTTLNLAGEWYFPPTVLAASPGGSSNTGQALKMGRVISVLDSETEAHLLALPPVPPAQSAALAERLRAEAGTLWPAGLPLPQAIPTRRLTQPYQPVLRLLEQGIPVQQPGRRTTQTQRFGLARLDHEYGGRLLTGRGHEWYAGGELILESPDPAAEQAAAQQLTRLGLKRVTKLLPRGAQTNLPEARRLYGFSDPERWQSFLEQDLPRLEAAGFQVELEASFPHHYAQIQDWYGETEMDGGWFTLELGVVIDGERYSLLPVIAALAEQRPELFSAEALAALTPEDTLTVRLEDGRRVQLPAERVRDILGVLGELHLGLEGTDILRLPLLDAARLTELAERVPAHWDGADELLELGQRLESFAGLPDVPPPQGLRAELRGYQREGVAWLQFLREYGLGGVLADDMGLGKTLMTLTHLLLEKEAGRADLPSLVAAPTSVLGGWRAEAERFAPDLRVLVLHGPGREQHFGSLDDYDLILTSYSLLPRDLDALKKQPLHFAVLDEAQNIKNHRSQAAQAAGQLRARHRLALTGTPLENHLGELWSLFHFVSPGLLGTAAQFREQFRAPIEKRGDTPRQRALNARVRPFILRREKSVVARELPPKTEIPVFLTLMPAQRDLRETVREGVLGRVQAELERRGLGGATVTVLDALLKLRQVATDPRLLRLKAAEGVTASAKRSWLQEQLPQLVEEGRRILIFSQFASLLTLLEEDLRDLGLGYTKLTGSTRNRAEVIGQFQGGAVPIFLISLKAGGVGLNLTAADTVIHLDPWWNPAAEAQATDRAYRIGQDKPVFVYKLIAESSVEERILEMQARKYALTQGVLDGGLTDAAALTPADLDGLFAPLDPGGTLDPADGPDPMDAESLDTELPEAAPQSGQASAQPGGKPRRVSRARKAAEPAEQDNEPEPDQETAPAPTRPRRPKSETSAGEAKAKSAAKAKSPRQSRSSRKVAE